MSAGVSAARVAALVAKLADVSIATVSRVVNTDSRVKEQTLNDGDQVGIGDYRLAIKVDSSGELLHSFIDLNNLALARFSAAERQRAIAPRISDADVGVGGVVRFMTFSSGLG